jgi:hypothetical protein
VIDLTTLTQSIISLISAIAAIIAAIKASLAHKQSTQNAEILVKNGQDATICATAAAAAATATATAFKTFIPSDVTVKEDAKSSYPNIQAELNGQPSK